MYDVVVYGATGFTGQLTAQYLAEHPQAPAVALAGRNHAKLQKVRDALTGISDERRASMALLAASAEDAASIQALARSAKVVIDTVGPYAKLGGFEVAQAVVEAGGGYVDLAGESIYCARLVQELHTRAQATHAVLVPSSGFDVLPFDLATYFAVQGVKKALGPDADVDHVSCGFDVRGSVSGGTLATMASMRTHPELLQYKHPYFLSPVQGTLQPKLFRSRWLPQFAKSGAYSLFAPHNTRIVSRSWGLLEEARLPDRYGATFRYLEAIAMPFHALAIVVSLVFPILAWLLVHVPYVDKLLAALVPPGTGASMATMRKGYVNLRTMAYGRDGKTQALSVFRVQGDPGYLKTAAFLAETALTLVLEKERLSPLARQGGVLTPATIGAEALAARLGQYAGVVIRSAPVPLGTDPASVLVEV